MKPHKFIGLFIASLLLFFACDPDEGDDAPGSDSTKTPAITSAAYNFTNGDLTLNGSNLPTADLQLAKITVSAGSGKSSTLAASKAVKKGKHTTSKHVYTINNDVVKAFFNKNGTKSAGGDNYNIALAKNWATASTGAAKDTTAITVSGVPTTPTITSAAITKDASDNYDLVLAGLNLGTADLQLAKITVAAGASAYVLSSGTASTKLGTHTATKHTYRINDTTAQGYFDRNGTKAADNDAYTLQLDNNWATSSTGAATTSPHKTITVSGLTASSITSATYNASTGALVIAGANLPTAQTGWDFTKLSIAGTGSSVTLSAHEPAGSDTTTGSSVGASAITIMFTGTDKNAIDAKLNVNGANNGSGVTYNLAAAAGFLVGQATLTDPTSNGITVSKIPAITSAAYVANTGVLTITGTDLPTAVNKWDFTKLSIVGKGDVASKVTLSAHENTAVNTTTGASTDATTFTITFRGTHRNAVNAVLDRNGTRSSDHILLNLDTAAGAFVDVASHADATGPITVTGVTASSLTSATYNFATGVLVITGVNLPTVIAGWDFTKLGLAGEGGTETLTAHGTGINDYQGSALSETSLTITAKGTKRALVNAKLDKNGTSSSGGTAYNLAGSAGFLVGQSTLADASSNTITVSGKP